MDDDWPKILRNNPSEEVLLLRAALLPRLPLPPLFSLLLSKLAAAKNAQGTRSDNIRILASMECPLPTSDKNVWPHKFSDARKVDEEDEEDG